MTYLVTGHRRQGARRRGSESGSPVPGTEPLGHLPFLPLPATPVQVLLAVLAYSARGGGVGDDPSPPQICVSGHSDCSSYYFIEHLLDAK